MKNVTRPETRRFLFLFSKYEEVISNTSGMLIERHACVNFERLSRFWKKDKSKPNSDEKNTNSLI